MPTDDHQTEEVADWTTETMEQAMAVASRALAASDQAVTDGRPRDAQALATVHGILVDKIRTAKREHRVPVATDPDELDRIIRARLIESGAAVGLVVHEAGAPCPASGRKAEQ
jgi:hypothetical protein